MSVLLAEIHNPSLSNYRKMASLLISSLCFLVFILTFKFLLQRKTFKNLPPCPPTLPIIGNFQNLSLPLHRCLHNLSQKYGHIFSLWFGSRRVIVICSPTLAQECFTKHDTVLANRPRFLTGKYFFYNYTSLDSIPYGDHWRNLRRIITLDVLSTHRLNSFSETRREETMSLIRKLANETCQGFTRVDLRTRLTDMTFNNMMRKVAGDVEDGWRFKEIMMEMLPYFAASNMADFVPLLQWLDYNGMAKKMTDIGKRADEFLQGLVDQLRNGKNNSNSMVQHLLSLQKSQPEYYSDEIIKGLIQGMFLGGTDTSAATIEWALSALLNHPNILKKAKDELDTYIGHDRLIDESDIPNLPYLKSIIYETLRLYSPAPLLLPRYSSDEFNMEGFTIPRDTIVFINAWSIHRDPKTWNEAARFMPERFEKEGEANKLITFGLGRRACPGIGLAYRTTIMTLGLLIQCFEWKRLNGEEIDMTENTSGVIIEKLVPLEAMCKAQPIIKKN